MILPMMRASGAWRSAHSLNSSLVVLSRFSSGVVVLSHPLIDDDDLKPDGFNFDFELWQPASKNHREIPDESQGD